MYYCVRVVQWRLYTYTQMMSYLCIDQAQFPIIWQEFLRVYPTSVFGWTGEIGVWYPTNMMYTFEYVDTDDQ